MLAGDLARHLQTRQRLGPAVVVTEQPLALLAQVRKQWVKVARQVARQRASTLNAHRIAALESELLLMRNLRFVAKSYTACPGAEVYFLSPEELRGMPPQCVTVYLGARVTGEVLRPLMTQLAERGLVVDYVGSAV